MTKEYNIKTVQDMIDCTNASNLSSFLDDLRVLIESAHEIRAMAKGIVEEKGIKYKDGMISSDGFLWIDDGLKNYEIIIEKGK